MRQESVFSVRTRGNAPHQGKPRVYFTCHPADFGRSFDQLCEDVFKTHDCAVYYTKDMSAVISEDERKLLADTVNLMVIPVSLKLLNDPNRAMDVDFPFAVANHIPVFPILLEPGLDALYQRKFGDLQYLDPFTRDPTAIPYEEKLKSQLDRILVSDELAEQIRKAFDAYIFLSYRKKDRQYANQLMRLIHSDPVCRDIAIWYDEFLTAGENFNHIIDAALEKSDLFAMLITPNMFEEGNYAFYKEYDKAHTSGKPVLSAQMKKTDAEDLKKLHTESLPVVDAYDGTALREELVKKLRGVALRENDGDPRHNFLIGLAYLDGIDVEKNHPRALDLITSAAEAELPEAMEKLINMYHDGYGVERDLRKALHWMEKYADYCKRTYGEEDPKAITALNKLAVLYVALGEYRDALKHFEKCYAFRRKMLGEEHSDTLATLNNLASVYSEQGDFQNALEIHKKVYELQCRANGKGHPDSLFALSNLAVTYGQAGDHATALALKKEVYELRRTSLGEEHPETLIALGNLAFSYGETGNRQKEMELEEKQYALQCKVKGEDHPDTLTALSNLAVTYGDLGNAEKSQELQEKAYTLRHKVLGEEHPDTLASLNHLVILHEKRGDLLKAVELQEKIYASLCKTQGEDYPRTLLSMYNLAAHYGGLGNFKKSAELLETVCMHRRKRPGVNHPDTIDSISALSICYAKLRNYQKAAELLEEVYALRRKNLSEDHPDTMKAMRNLAGLYTILNDHSKAAQLCEEQYAMQCRKFGRGHPNTFSALLNLAIAYGNAGNYSGKKELFRMAYDISFRLHGPTAKETVNMLCNLAMANAADGETEEALNICNFLLRLDTTLPPNTIRKLITLCEQNGKPDVADALRKALATSH